MNRIETLEDLENIYGKPKPPALVKVAHKMTAEYQAFIETAPFLALATCGAAGLDCSPRGDLAGFVRIENENTLLLPDRAGNNRVDSLANIIQNPQISLMFMIPGVSNIIRVNGEAWISVDPDQLASFAVKGKEPRSVIVIAIREIYFQCARAIVRSKLWDMESQINPETLPSPGEILAAMSGGREGGRSYDKAWPGRAKETLW
jgi:uncharacterized protein